VVIGQGHITNAASKLLIQFGEYRYVIRLEDESERDQWLEAVQGSVEWQDTLEGYVTRIGSTFGCFVLFFRSASF
jgi:hypothetical protein